MSAAHTPTPWVVFGGHRYPGVDDASGDESIIMFGDLGDESGVRGETCEQSRANAAFIVRAANSFDDLVAALKYLLEREQIDDDDDLTLVRAREAARGALAKAEQS